MTRFLLFILSIVLFLTNLYSQDLKFYGSKYLRYYPPEEYGDAAQVWTIARDKSGLMYFGSDNLVVFDGKNWQKYEIPGSKTLRTIEIDNNGRIYVGGAGQFGFFEPAKNGKLEFTSLKSLIADSINFQTIWKIITTTKKTYFISAHYLFVYDGETMEVYNDKNMIFQAQFGFVIDGKPYISVFPQGISVFEDGKIVPLFDTTQTPTFFGFINFLKYSDKKILLLTIEQGLYLYDLTTGELTPFAADKEVLDFIAKNTMYQAIKVNDTAFAVGTLRGGVIIFDNKGKVVNTYNVNKGLKTNAIYTLYADPAGDLWLGTENGIIRIDISSPIMFYNENQNLRSYPTLVRKFGDRIFLGALGALYFFEDYNLTSDDNHLLKRVEGVSSVWDFYKISNQDFLVGGENKIHALSDTNIMQTHIINSNATCFGSSPLHPGIIFGGFTEGLAFFEYNAKKNKFENYYRFDNIQTDIRQIQPDKYGNLWLGSKSDGAIYMRFTDDSIKNVEFTFFKKVNSRKIKSVRFFVWKDTIYLLSDKGIYEISYPDTGQPDSLISFKPATNWTKFFKSDTLSLSKVLQINDTLFFVKGDEIGLLNLNSDSVFSKPFLRIKQISDVSKIGHYLFLSQHNALYIYDMTKTKNYDKKFDCHISEVIIGNDSTIFNGYYYTYSEDSVKIVSLTQPLDFIPVLDYKNNSITFVFSATFYEEHDKTEYSYFLEGYDNKWRKYSTENKAIYTNLNEGDYTFYLKAKNVYGTESNILTYKFKILPPWYRTWWAYSLFMILGLLVFYLALKLYSRRLKQANIRLEKIVAERTKQIREQNEELMRQKEELQQQKEEILAQAEELEKINKELEKLSIVAEKTDNAVLIFDKNLDLIWTNKAYEKIYGKNAFEGKQINLLRDSASAEIKKLIEEMLDTGKSVKYKNIIRTSSGDIRYVQTSLTPIFDYQRKLSKVIAIESDITEIEKANILISEKNKVIEASLNYAETIQKSILPDIDKIKKYFQFAIIYKPKDIVSGDFYWFKELKITNPKLEFETLMIVADCTGHGVPGAFMSLIAGRLLDETISYENITDPAQILNIVSDKVIDVLRQNETNNTDGFDIAICKITKFKNSDKAKVTFAGAKMSVYYFLAQEKQLIRLRGNSKRIGWTGKLSREKEFTNYYFDLSVNDTLYMMSDGYIDQSNEKRKKLGSVNFKKFVMQVALLPVDEQIKYLNDQLEKWQNGTPQRDDITLCALKIL